MSSSSSSRFQTVTIGVLRMTDSAVTIAADKPLVLGTNGTDSNHAVTKGQLDSVASNLESAINAIAGNDITLDTLAEMKHFVDGVELSGATNLLTAVNTLSASTDTAISLVSSAASSALASVNNALQQSIGDEASARDVADVAITRRLFRDVHVQLSSIVRPDEGWPSPMPSIVKAATEHDGWYFTNGGPGTSNRKINWYFGAPTDATGDASGASLLEVDLPLRLISPAKRPWITVYTKLTGSGDATSWYHARYNYIANSTLAANTNYLFRALISGSTAVGSLSGFSNVDLTIDPSASTNTPLLATDRILSVVISTDSSAAAGGIQCVFHGMDIQSTNGNVAYHLSNNDVVHRHILLKLAEVYRSMGQSDSELMNYV